MGGGQGEVNLGGQAGAGPRRCQVDVSALGGVGGSSRNLSQNKTNRKPFPGWPNVAAEVDFQKLQNRFLFPPRELLRCQRRTPLRDEAPRRPQPSSPRVAEWPYPLLVKWGPNVSLSQASCSFENASEHRQRAGVLLGAGITREENRSGALAEPPYSGERRTLSQWVRWTVTYVTGKKGLENCEGLCASALRWRQLCGGVLSPVERAEKAKSQRVLLVPNSSGWNWQAGVQVHLLVSFQNLRTLNYEQGRATPASLGCSKG